MSTLVTVLFGFSVLVLLFTLFPFEVAMPLDLYNFLISGIFKDVFETIYYFLPINFIVTCILFVFALRHSKLLLNIITWIYHKLFT